MNETLMALINTVWKTAVQTGDVVSNAAKGVSKKTDALLANAKLNSKIAEKQRAINAVLQEIGEILYATHTGTPTDSDVLLEKLKTIDTLKAEIKSMELEKEEEKNALTCPVCGAFSRAGDTYCRECGIKLDTP